MLENFVTSFMMLFIVLDPVGISPYVAALTAKLDKRARTGVIRLAVISAGVLLLSFVFAGVIIFEILGIETGEFKIAAGLMLLVYAMADLFEIPIGFKSEGRSESIAIFPLATPLLAGPGSVATVLYIREVYGTSIAVASAVANLVVAYPILLSSILIVAKLGRHGALLINKFMSLIMVAFAISVIREGMQNLGMVT